MMHRTYGKFRAVVVDRQDPAGQGRIRVEAPILTGGEGGARGQWAVACVPPGYRALPAVGETVWIEFEEGDLDRPLRTGCAWPDATGNQAACSIEMDAGGSVRIAAAAEVEVVASRVEVTTAMLEVPGTLRCATVIATTGVVSPSYTPGAGNIW